ncbi:Bardet-Biedl syndrome 4 protein [Symbiodinium microadriaticum]|uniref:Bardet-Biedl syndrome 4 protein n=1 Tax=Symbiodinium microadriaticum TaxID=2951 RepID=A0A1Q9C1A9_SYMMI|nr:Bardet-Biedl syndrome 4 protein [Symbiodinium microadriaticum]
MLQETMMTITTAVSSRSGLCHMYLRQYDSSIDCFTKANAIQRHDVTFMQLGKVYALQEDYKSAIDVYTEALEFSPEHAELLTTLGILYLRMGENFKAFDYLGNALTHDPKNAKTILAAGSIIQDHSDMDVALIKYRVAAVHTPNSAQLWNNIGMCFFGKTKYVAAIACLKRALYLDPFEWIISYNLGLVHLNTGQFASGEQADAEQVQEPLSEGDPSDAEHRRRQPKELGQPPREESSKPA